MSNRRTWALACSVIFGLAASACSPQVAAPSAAPATETVVLPSPTSAPPTSTETPAPTPTPRDTPTPAPTATPSIPLVTSRMGDVRCWFGPGTMYSLEAALAFGKSVPILGRDASSGWWYIENPGHTGWHCWLSADETDVVGDAGGVPVVPPPVPFVESVTVVMNPHKASITCSAFPYTFSVDFTIVANGPTKVTFQRSLSDGHTAPAETATFLAAGSKEFSDSYRVGEVGNPWFRVTVTSPNRIVGEGSAQMSCTP